MSAARPQMVMFADVSGSTRLFEQRGDVEARRLIAALLGALALICRTHHGRVVKTIGDEVMCAFPTPVDGVEAAIAMQRHVAGDASSAAHRLAIRIGLHHGECLEEEDGDVYGDAVNTAARLSKLANPGQIVTTASTTAGVRAPLFRALGPVAVAGKQQRLDLVDVLWSEHPAAMTMVQVFPGLAPGQGAEPRLVLEYRGHVRELSPSSPPLSLGRDPGNDLVVEADCVSRQHATVEYRHGHFVLVDRSTNGSFMRVDGDEDIRLHREAGRLRRSGVIGLGRAIGADADAGALVYFRGP